MTSCSSSPTKEIVIIIPNCFKILHFSASPFPIVSAPDRQCHNAAADCSQAVFRVSLSQAGQDFPVHLHELPGFFRGQGGEQAGYQASRIHRTERPSSESEAGFRRPAGLCGETAGSAEGWSAGGEFSIISSRAAISSSCPAVWRSIASRQASSSTARRSWLISR